MPTGKHLEEIVEKIFPVVVTATRIGVRSALAKKGVPLNVLSYGADLGEIQTEADVKASKLFLDAVRPIYPGSFTEEDDTHWDMRMLVEELYENDPLDGTGDLFATMGSENIIGPTNLTVKLRRAPDGRFVPVAGMIYDVLGEYAIISDGKKLLIGKAAVDGSFEVVPYHERQLPTLESSLKINQRHAYPQTNFDQAFPAYLKKREGVRLERVPVGGAGTQAIHLIRNVIDLDNPSEIPAFSERAPIDVMFNAQPDWKTWDVDPMVPIFRFLDFSEPISVYGGPLLANAAGRNLKPEMVHNSGVVVSSLSGFLNLSGMSAEGLLTKQARAFERDTGKRLTEINY